MKPKAFRLTCMLIVFAFVALITSASAMARTSFDSQQVFSFTIMSRQYYGLLQEKTKEQPKVSKDELQAAKKVEAAPDAAARLKAAGEFLKKHPNSPLRPQVAGLIAQKIEGTEDAAQKITLIENYTSLFNDPNETDRMQPVLIEAYIKANRLEDAFRVASTYVEKNPDDVGVMTRMSLLGIEQVKRDDQSFLQQSQQWGTKAIELFEANKKPANIEDAQWNEYKTKWLPQLYQSLGFLSMMMGNAPDARTKLEKAMSLNPSDPFNYVFMGNLLNNEYIEIAQKYNAAAAGAGKDELLKKAHAQMDKVIDAYAHAVALTEGNPQYQPLREQVMQILQETYKQRHKNTEGLQQLIDKYKKSSTPK